MKIIASAIVVIGLALTTSAADAQLARVGVNHNNIRIGSVNVRANIPVHAKVGVNANVRANARANARVNTRVGGSQKAGKRQQRHSGAGQRSQHKTMGGGSAGGQGRRRQP